MTKRHPAQDLPAPEGYMCAAVADSISPVLLRELAEWLVSLDGTTVAEQPAVRTIINRARVALEKED